MTRRAIRSGTLYLSPRSCYPSGQGIGSWLACHEFEPITTKHPPYKAAMHVKSVESSNVHSLMPAQVSYSSLDHGSKLRDPSPKALVLYPFTNGNNFINPNQYGFTKHFSTYHPLLRLTEKISSGFERGRSSRAVFLDIQKAFDRVWVRRLTYKLITNTFPPALIHLINSYLVNRTFKSTNQEARSQSRPRGRGSLVVKVSDCGWLATSSSPVPQKTRRVWKRCTLNPSGAQTSCRW
ncbi:RNA-directed DNA polymerase from mobile element jockey [Trichonephila clavipes]|nr:RNA-directed DNA polymerase from mobile element jockey [Trichonephila clavipes]